MKRDYDTGIEQDIVFFIGNEVEKTPAFGMKTLFVVGLQDPSIIKSNLEDCKHIFFGANHSYDPMSQGNTKNDYFEEWTKMIEYFLKDDYMCSLDIPINAAEEFLEDSLIEYDNFIPQLRIPLPYVNQWNYNTMLKIDDKDFKATNPGVWCHSLHDLLDREKFTDWNKYGLDKVIK